MNFVKAKNYSDLSRKAANIIAAQITLKQNSVLGLATGSTPLGVYKQLIKMYRNKDITFANAITVNLDEYCGLSSEHEQSYRAYMNKHLFDNIDIKKKNTFLPNGTAQDYEKECVMYDKLIDSIGGIDILLLGVGHNGHIGFNEPGQVFKVNTHCVDLSLRTRQANARFFESDVNSVPKKALTLGLKNIMNAKKILMVASGREKLDILESAFSKVVTPRIPVSILQLHLNCTVILSEEQCS